MLPTVYLFLTAMFIAISVVEFYDFLVGRRYHNLFLSVLSFAAAVLMLASAGTLL